jgi:hypothetical protein
MAPLQTSMVAQSPLALLSFHWTIISARSTRNKKVIYCTKPYRSRLPLPHANEMVSCSLRELPSSTLTKYSLSPFLTPKPKKKRRKRKEGGYKREKKRKKRRKEKRNMYSSK